MELDRAELKPRIPTHLTEGLIDFTAGSLGGIALVYVGQPLDTVKVKMQTYPHIYHSMFECCKQTFYNEGIRKGLYAGTVPALIANIAENSVLFLFYGVCQKFIQKITHTPDINKLTKVDNAFAGSLASFFSTFALTPTELIKCKLQAAHEKTKLEEKHSVKIGPGRMVSQIFKNEGVLGLFRGFVPTLAREMPGYFFFFGGYEGARDFFKKPGQKKDEIGLWRTMVSGGVGGTVFWTVTFPIDVVKSRIQICRTEGIRGLYAGLTPTLIRTLPASAALFGTYEYSKKFLHYLSQGY